MPLRLSRWRLCGFGYRVRPAGRRVLGLGLESDFVLRLVVKAVDVDSREVVRDGVVGGPGGGTGLAVLDLDLAVVGGNRLAVDGDLALRGRGEFWLVVGREGGRFRGRAVDGVVGVGDDADVVLLAVFEAGEGF